MHYDDMVDIIWEEYLEQLNNFAPSGTEAASKWSRAAFGWALKNCTERLSSRNVIDHRALEHTDTSYVRHMEKRTALEFGAAIFDNKEMFKQYTRDSFMGKEIDQCMFIVKINPVNELRSKECADDK